MKLFYLLLLMIGLFTACSNDNYHDSGLANGDHDCSMWEYFQKSPENWDSTMLLIQRAGLQDIFEGNNPQYSQITFFGPTNLSIQQYMYRTEDDEVIRYHSILEIPEEECRNLILSHIIPQRMLKSDFDYEIKGTLTGGTTVKNLMDRELRIYRIKTSYGGIPDIGPEELGLHALTDGAITSIASSDIKTQNGVVHSLSNTYQLTEL